MHVWTTNNGIAHTGYGPSLSLYGDFYEAEFSGVPPPPRTMSTSCRDEMLSPPPSTSDISVARICLSETCRSMKNMSNIEGHGARLHSTNENFCTYQTVFLASHGTSGLMQPQAIALADPSVILAFNPYLLSTLSLSGDRVRASNSHRINLALDIRRAYDTPSHSGSLRRSLRTPLVVDVPNVMYQPVSLHTRVIGPRESSTSNIAHNVFGMTSLMPIVFCRVHSLTLWHVENDPGILSLDFHGVFISLKGWR